MLEETFFQTDRVDVGRRYPDTTSSPRIPERFSDWRSNAGTARKSTTLNRGPYRAKRLEARRRAPPGARDAGWWSWGMARGGNDREETLDAGSCSVPKCGPCTGDLCLRASRLRTLPSHPIARSHIAGGRIRFSLQRSLQVVTMFAPLR